MSDLVARYKRWVDEMVSRPESMEKARRHEASKIMRRELKATRFMRKSAAEALRNKDTRG